jgi:hypothetical protein
MKYDFMTIWTGFDYSEIALPTMNRFASTAWGKFMWTMYGAFMI